LVHLEVIPALPREQPVLANLLELYIHDFSEFLDIQLGADGRFDYPHLSLYWSDPGRHPFLIRIDGKLAGFVLVRQGSEVSGDRAVWDLAEFFVVRGHRRHGIGTAAAQEIWRRLPGWWEIRVMPSNDPARRFWERAVSRFAGETIHSTRVETRGKCLDLFSFESRPVPAP
jgi:predicted acetyltransferase